MEQYLPILTQTPLFRNIQEKELISMLECLDAWEKYYERESYIWLAGQAATAVGVVLQGSVYILQEDYLGNRTIVAKAAESDPFGEAFSCAQTPYLPVSVQAAEDCRVLLLDYHRIISTCSSACMFHSKLIENMLFVLAEKNILLNRKIEHLAQRSTREKLLSYLAAQARQAHSRDFIIPFNRQELADFLCVERSAMSAELSRMQKEGLLSYQRNHFTLSE